MSTTGGGGSQAQVLQLPLAKSKELRDTLHGVASRLGISKSSSMSGTRTASLTDVLKTAGYFFGKNPDKWEPIGEPRVDITEDGPKRYIKKTGMFWGYQLHLWLENPLFDSRLAALSEGDDDGSFSQQMKLISSEEDWEQISCGQPVFPTTRRKMVLSYLCGQLKSGEPQLQMEGAHGLWELSIKRAHHVSVTVDCIVPLLQNIQSQELEVVVISVAAVWGLAASQPMRRIVTELGGIRALQQCLSRTLNLTVTPDEPSTGEEADPMTINTSSPIRESARNRLQRFVLGAMGVLFVDRVCRAPYIQDQPSIDTLIRITEDLEGYTEPWASQRRIMSARIICSMIQRDPLVRSSIVETGALKRLIALLDTRMCNEDERSVDVLLLVDKSPRMGGVISAIRSVLVDVVKEATKTMKGFRVNVGCVAYGNYDDVLPWLAQPFTDNIASVVKFLEGVEAGGGEDYAQDVFMALEQVTKMEWTSASRLIYHVSDAPCHGTMYHNGNPNDPKYDASPEGDQYGRDGHKLLNDLVKNCGVQRYYFAHLAPEHTEKMLTRFREHVGDEAWVVEQRHMVGLHRSAGDRQSLTEALRKSLYGTVLSLVATEVSNTKLQAQKQPPRVEEVEAMHAGPPVRQDHGSNQDKKDEVMFAIMSALSMLVLDEEAMTIMQDKGQVQMLFESCLFLLLNTLQRLVPGKDPTFKKKLGVSLAESAAHALWGSAYFFTMPDTGVAIQEHYIVFLGMMGLETWANQSVPLGRVANFVTCTIAVMCSNGHCADNIMSRYEEHGILDTLLILLKVGDVGLFQHSSYVRAAAATALAFLACHPMGCKGDDCLFGSYRTALLDVGAFEGLLECALTPSGQAESDSVIEQSCAVGLMYLTTMAGDLSASALSMYASLMSSQMNIEMVEYLMAGMWILLKNPHNRAVLGQAFKPNPATSDSSVMNTFQRQMDDVVEIHDINNAVGKLHSAASSPIAEPGADLELPPSQFAEGEGLEDEIESPEPASADEAPQPSGSGVDSNDAGGAAADVEQEDHGDGAAAVAKDGEAGEAAPEPAADEASAGEGDGSSGPDGACAELETGEGGSAGESDNGPRQSHDSHSSGGSKTLYRAQRSCKSMQRHVGLQADAEARLPEPEVDMSKIPDSLPGDWGLDTLVRVGESWMPKLLVMTREDTDVALMKLFEFLMASMCLFLIPESDEIPDRYDNCYQNEPAHGSKRSGWWTVTVEHPLPMTTQPELTQRATAIMIAILGLKVPVAWKAMQLSVVTIWNCTSRSASLERYVAESGALMALLDIVACPDWPHTLRACSSGLLQSFSEHNYNMEWMGGVVPLIKSSVVLLNSKIPLLELCGARAMARTCCAAPLGVSSPRLWLDSAKNEAVTQGAIKPLIQLLQTTLWRYNQLAKGKLLTSSARPVNADDSDDPGNYERNMNTMDAVLEMFQYTLIAVLNMSVLKTNQVPIARKGLPSLLGVNCHLEHLIAGGGGGEEEVWLQHLCSAILQNLSMHPGNRTSFYEAELRGALSIEKQHQELFSLGQEVQGRWHLVKQSLRGSKCQLPPLSKKSVQAQVQLVSKRKTHNLPVNSSMDTSLAQTLRPKVIFPSVFLAPSRSRRHLGSRESRARSSADPPDLAEGSSSTLEDSAPAAVRSTSTKALDTAGPLSPTKPPQAPPERAPGAAADGTGPSAEGGEAAPAEPRGEQAGEVREHFMQWMDLTFQDQDCEHNTPLALDTEHGRERRIVDSNGEWINERESIPSLNTLLRRPLTHLWQDYPQSQLRHGNTRWHPSISEYQEVASGQRLLYAAEPLLRTPFPRNAKPLDLAAQQLAATGSFSVTSVTGKDRPTTASRSEGRTPLTKLRRWGLQKASQQLDDAVPAAAGPGEDGDARTAAAAAAAAAPTVALQVAMSPQRGCTLITFKDGIRDHSDPSKPRLTIFNHSSGARVYTDTAMPVYTLPNGRQAFYYYQRGSMVDEVEVPALEPPQRPTSVPQALQQSMPLGAVLDTIAKPPGRIPPLDPYRPIPDLVPLPSKHLLKVKEPHKLQASAFGDLREDNLQLTLVARRMTKTRVTTTVESVFIPPPEEKEPWTLPMSIFKPRVRESDARDYFDTPQVVAKMFERDWARCCSKEKFTGMVKRESKGGEKDESQSLADVQQVLKDNYTLFCSTFVYYAGLGSGSPLHMQLNAFTAFLDDCQIPDNESAYVKRSDCDTLFIVSNFQQDKRAPENKVNDEHALMRFEFMEGIVRIAVSKFGKGQQTNDPAEAVQMLFKESIVPHVPGLARQGWNQFRKDRLYNEEVDNVFKKHANLLKAIYSRYRLRPPGGGLRTKVLKLEGWMQLMQDALLLDDRFTIQDGTLVYMWSRMVTVDEVQDFAKYESLTFIDFLEALGRVADKKWLPAAIDLSESTYDNILEWHIAKLNGEIAVGDPLNESAPTNDRRGSPGLSANPSRPLYASLEMLLDLMFRRLFYDPNQPGVAFTHDGLLRMVKKQDKDLGS